MYTVQYTSRAIKDINKLPPEARKRIFDAITEIKEKPYSHVKKLKTSPDSPIYSLRVGEYRVLLNITRSQLIIFVIGAGYLSTVYRKF
ncbi:MULTISPECIES: type II toxin-antitoxin system RelE family toxin [Methanosarcina]|uniref:RelE/StbE replicon stabilization toxin n=1 Tax=Methanosarcina vacuolata Z-761 TaxID=1434123 RepID=A0A0E3Q985_9EURY|nr:MULTISPECIES: type II toxin-antitoxin system RelE/ParE family toxin [Methanosarcina]AKB45348.1 RelE/StbE replicon stabilization toxin [Methanosarcina vacuolata Z-761]AKB48819.1 RelE/StbE replicon stabilization toxin [Methanosarcina sp. Kolksee]